MVSVNSLIELIVKWMASIVVPIVIGFLVKEGDFAPALIFVGALGIAGACSYMFLVGRIDQNSL